jgi:hypothetical protein
VNVAEKVACPCAFVTTVFEPRNVCPDAALLALAKKSRLRLVLAAPATVPMIVMPVPVATEVMSGTGRLLLLLLVKSMPRPPGIAALHLFVRTEVGQRYTIAGRERSGFDEQVTRVGPSQTFDKASQR